MKRIKSIDELKSTQEKIQKSRDANKPCIAICAGTGCLAYGTQKLIDGFKAELEKNELTEKVDFRTTGCRGFCERGPMIVIYPENIFYQKIGLDDVAEIVQKTFLNGSKEASR
ncbi:MAG: (2Fe-2S) ferredoxin domain-containing protein [Syntrophales bacterium]